MPDICPIIKTREALYSGGMSADGDDNEECKCRIGGIDYYFDDVPMLVADDSFEMTRQNMNKKYNGAKMTAKGRSDDDILLDCRVTHALRDRINNDALEEFKVTGSYENITSEDVVKRYSHGKNIREKERSMVRTLREMVNGMGASVHHSPSFD